MARPVHTDGGQLPVADARDLARRVADCTSCGLHATRTHAIAGDGPVDARVVVVGVAPGRHEDLHGRAIAGGPRNVIEHAITSAGLEPSTVRFTSLVRCRPPKDRPIARTEVQRCSQHLRAELEMVRPEVIVTLGGLATAVLYGRPVSIEQVSGYRLDVLHGVTLVPTYHPVDVIRGVPQAAASLRRDFATVKAVLDGTLRTGAQVLEDLRSTTPADS